MSGEQENAAGASGGEQNVASASVPDAPKALELFEAESIFGDIFNEPGEGQAVEDESSALEASADAGEGGEGSEAEGGETDQTPGEEPETDGETEDPAPELLTGNFKIRLRDGSEVTAKELRKVYGEHRDIERRAQEVAEKERQLAERSAQPAQMDANSVALLNYAQQVVASRIPPPPDERLRLEDPMEFLLQRDNRNAAIAEWQRMNQAAQVEHQKVQAQQAADQQKYVREQREKIAEKMGITTAEQASEFWGKLIPEVKKFGFKDDELNTPDHRFWLLGQQLLEGKKAIEELAKAKAAAKDKQVPGAKPIVPVAKPGIRATTSESRIQNAKELAQRTRQPLSVEDAQDVMARIF